MKLDQLINVLEVAESKSINKAAQKLFVAQPNLSNSIIQLEEELDMKIFNRNARGVQVTKDGEELLKHIKRITDEIRVIENMKSMRKRISKYDG